MYLYDLCSKRKISVRRNSCEFILLVSYNEFSFNHILLIIKNKVFIVGKNKKSELRARDSVFASTH